MMEAAIEYDVREKIDSISDNRLAFLYSDGDDCEQYILGKLQGAADLTTGSEELSGYIRDWPTEYHFSAKRADLLRPFANRLRGRSVLEIGSGCGAITRFLGECHAMVTAVEGSARRARITAERCRDQENVTVINENFAGFETRTRFDFILLIGALEYSKLYIPGDNPPLQMITRAAGLLKEKGVLIIAIENQLGLKYWAGAPEDHLNRIYGGLEGFYAGKSPVTFGKKALTALLIGAGLDKREFFFPFPDYKLPAVLLRERALTTPEFNVGNLIQPNADGSTSGSATFMTQRVVPILLDNGLMADLANSFLIVAGKTAVKMVDDPTIAFSFNSTRKKPYNKMNVFSETSCGSIHVNRVPHYPACYSDPGLPIAQVLRDEPYVPGALYSLGLMDMLSSPGWSLQGLRNWAQPYFHLLKNHACLTGGKDLMEGIYVDLVPFNLLVADGDRLEAIDLEWAVKEMIPLEYVFFRGIYHCLARAKNVCSPSPGTPLNAFSLCLAAVEGFIPDIAGLLEDFINREVTYFGSVLMDGNFAPGDFDLHFATKPNGSPMASSALGTRQYPLLNLNLQLFLETATSDFQEATSVKFPIGLTREKEIYTFPPQDFPANALRLRIDPSDRPGFLCVHSVSLRSSEGIDLFHWTPFSHSNVELNGVVIVKAAAGLPDPVTILLNHDPMMIFSVPESIRGQKQELLTVALELSALAEPLSAIVLGTMHQMAAMLS